MRTLARLLLLSALLLPAAGASARQNDFGRIRHDKNFGIGLGTGTFANGLSFKKFAGDGIAFQANFGTFGGHGFDRYHLGGIAGSIDALLEMPALGRNQLLRLGWNVGVGVGAGISDTASTLGLAGAFIAGLEFELQPLPVDLVIEWRPKFGILAGDSDLFQFDVVDFTAHIRIYLF